MLDIGLLLTIIGVLLAAPVLWIVGLVVVAFGALRWLVGATTYLVGRLCAPLAHTTPRQRHWPRWVTTRKPSSTGFTDTTVVEGRPRALIVNE